LDHYATRPEAPLSLPIRMEKKRKRTKAGVAATTVGILLLGGSGYNLTQSGSEVIAIYMAVLAVPLILGGISLLARASKDR
jgi:hypothetical protein